MPVLKRELTREECQELYRRAHSRTGSVRSSERARIILAAAEAEEYVAVARMVGVDKKTVRQWIDRFRSCGLEGLEDAPRSGHPFRYTAEQRSAVVQLALTPPRELGLPFGSWTFDRLEAYLNEQLQIAMKRSRIQELLIHEGLRWHREEGWIGEKVDPAFLEKRGALSKRTARHLRAL